MQFSLNSSDGSKGNPRSGFLRLDDNISCFVYPLGGNVGEVSLVRALLYIIAQCLGAICGVGLVKGFQSAFYVRYGGGANELSSGFSKGTGLAAEIIGTFVLVYTVFSATDPKRSARDSHVPVLAPLPIGFAVFMVHLATIPITGTGINPARSLGAAVIYNNEKAWDDHLLFQ
ncbi:Aquaporin PIP2-5 [Triticum urartu]|uniref:Uncharacterized protein n=2 Tax=Triticum TaxID=4564 RepID=A0A9R1P097_TRITD|nr:Aquaporin PIP2-5 [Triticum urartu]VAH34489.1 unnamed protein product [Triticum turgidum subsp. durum]